MAKTDPTPWYCILLLIIVGSSQSDNTYSEIYHMTSGDSVNVSSPGYPRFYPDNLDMTLYFTDNDNGSFIINVHELALVVIAQYYYDYFTIGIGDNSSTGAVVVEEDLFLSPGTTFVLPATEVWIRFRTGYKYRSRGFTATVERISDSVPCVGDELLCGGHHSGSGCIGDVLVCRDCSHNYPQLVEAINDCDRCSNDDFWCSSGFGCVAQSMVCDNVLHCMDGSDEWECYPCEETITTNITMMPGDVVYITSPSYPSYRPLDLICTWYFDSPNPGHYDISMIFVDVWELDVATGHSFTSENIVGQFLWTVINRMLVSNADMWMKFRRWAEWLDSGFFVKVERVLNYESCHPSEFPCQSGFSCIDHSLVCNVHSECYDSSDEHECDFCNSREITIYKQNTTRLHSLPGYPYNYPDGLSCIWQIHAASRDGFILIAFINFGASIGYDLFSVGNGRNVTDESTVVQLTGEAPLNTVTLNSTSAWITFVTTDSHHGFNVDLEVHEEYVACKDDEFLCHSGYGCLSSALLCDNVEQCLRGSDELDCDLCGKSLIKLHSQSDAYNLSSPGYPEEYPVDLNCAWTTSVAGDGGVPLIEFLDFDVSLPEDYLKFGDGMSIFYELSGDRPPVCMIMNRTEVTLSFDSYIWNYGYTGFLLQVSATLSNTTCRTEDFLCQVPHLGLICFHGHQRCDGIPDCPDESDEQDCGECGARYINLGSDEETVQLKTPGYPISYRNDLVCEWIVRATGHRKVIMDVIDFDMENRYDFLIVGNGQNSGVGSSTIARLTGRAKMRTLVSSGPYMWLRVASDRTGTGRGFHVDFTRRLDVEDVCKLTDFDCGGGICVDPSAECDGFNDCLNFAEETHCAYITCPGSYLCDEAKSVAIRMCVPMEDVCDGQTECPVGDDEIECDTKRCPENCECMYDIDDNFVVKCKHGWTIELLKSTPLLTYSMELNANNLSSLESGDFKGLMNLRTLSLSRNGLEELQPRTFDGLGNLVWLDLSYNNIKSLESLVFEELSKLEELFLYNVPLTNVFNKAFWGLSQLKVLVIVRGESAEGYFDFQEQATKGLKNLHQVYVDDHRLCCQFADAENCRTLEPTPPLFNCGSLMQNNFLRVCMWILGISAVFGNFVVLIMRLAEKSVNSVAAKQSLFIGNLAVSDSLMGMYMLILASADLYYGNEYFLYSDQWRSGTVCKIASFLGLLSSEASVFFITLISVDRFISLLFPFSKFQIRSNGSKAFTLVIWIFALTLAVVPTLYAGPDSDLYDLSDVCIGLPLITRPTSFTIESSGGFTTGGAGTGNTGNAFDIPVPKDSKPAWYFSIGIFLGLNLVCFLAIMICYIVIFWTIKQSRKQVNRAANIDEEIKIALKMAAVVGTDFICWFPVIIMGILSQTGLAVIPLEMYTWSVVFILPVNSSLNPYLYTLASLISDYRNKVREAKSTMSMTDFRLKGRSGANFNSQVTESVNFQSQMD